MSMKAKILEQIERLAYVARIEYSRGYISDKSLIGVSKRIDKLNKRLKENRDESKNGLL